MITEDYCSFEVAKLLKEKGFDTFKPYGWDEELFDKEHPRNFSISFDNKEHWISCPTHQMAMKWLREKHVIIAVQPECFNGVGECPYWGVDIWADDNYEELQGDFPFYEQAVEAALKYSLENLI